MTLDPIINEPVVLERMLAAIVDSSDDAILSKTLDGTILSWNKGAERIYGYTAEEVIGRHVSILVPEGRPDEIPNILDRLRRGERIDHFETVRRKKDGTLIHVSLSVSPLSDEKGQIIGASAISRDVTEHNRFREERNFLASIVDSSEDAVLSKDLNGTILSWNKGAERLYGYTLEEMVGRHVSVLVPPDRLAEIPEFMRLIAEGESIEQYETIRLTKDGTRIDISLTVSPVVNAAGRIVAASAIARNITSRKRSEQEKNRLLRDLTDSLAQKNVLLQEVHHRVKNNLQMISSLLEMRLRYISRDSVEATAAFEDSIARIHAMALVHEKLYKSDNLDRVDFTAYLHNLIEHLVNSYAADRPIEIRITGDSCHFPVGTSIPLGLIFSELITNSLKYAYPSTAELIEIDFRVENDAIKVHLSDSGPGLPPGIDFQTIESFGFRIVKLLTRQIHGEIAYVRRENGTSFQIDIPNPIGQDHSL